ncbi:Trans-aconitate 3-methyltransferase [Nakaseomyces bracarensis]|uniref:Trans-aconitate 3-methyltransferase n=1 Tax=Nakaseomyces bracarensis TaxID=273131 RepID=A0ABR4NX89_9SACH
MSTFSASNFDSDRYSKSRPSYPAQFYQELSNFHKGSHHCLVDIGCGPGTATFQLRKYIPQFEEYIGCDMSSPMIKKANEKLGETSYENVRFQQSSYEDFSFLEGQKCDMITCVEAVHWFDIEKFQQVSFDSLSESGTLAIWGYIDGVLTDYPQLDNYFQDLTYGPTKMGPYWEQPGKTILKNKYKDVHIDTKLFKEVSRHTLTPDMIRSPDFRIDSEPLPIVTKMPLQGYMDYIRTWSGYHTWKQENSDKPDIVEETLNYVLENTDISDPAQEVNVAWNSFYIFARK